MLPSAYNDGISQDFFIEKQPTLTYRLRFDGKQSFGTLCGLEAMKQAILLILNTERFKYSIYSWNYGVEFNNLIGEIQKPFVRAKIQQAIEEALLADDRILEIKSFSFQKYKKSTVVSFLVITTEGELHSEYEFKGDEID